MATPEISLVLPIYNQADHVREIVAEYVERLQAIPYSYEIILVVNGSRDDSLAICQALAEDRSTIRVLSSEAGGWGLAVRLGIAAAQGEHICYTNSARTSGQDLQLCLLYAKANPGVTVKANRRIRETWFRRLGSLLYNLECRALFDLAYWDINGTPKVFPARMSALRRLERNDDLIDLEYNVICREQGYLMLEVPIFSTRRHGGKSTTNYRSALRMYLGAYRLWRERRLHRNEAS